MKILIASSGASSLNGFRLPLIKHWRALGHEVIATACEESSATAEDLATIGVRFLPIPVGRASLNPLKDISLVLKIARLLRRERIDVAFLFQQKAVLYGGLAAKLARTPKTFAMVTGLGYAFMPRPGLKFKIVNTVASALYRMAVRCFDGMLFQNPDDMQFVRETFLNGNEKLPLKRVYGSGVDLSEFSYREESDKNAFLFVGRLVADKGIREYIRAGELLRNLKYASDLRILGGLDSNPSAISEEQLTAWENAKACRYLGRTKDVRPVVGAASVFVLPSYREGTPRSALEAMAIGRPIITTNTPGCREVVFFENGMRRYEVATKSFTSLPKGSDVRDFPDDILCGDNGFLVPPKRAESLAAAMAFYLENPEVVLVHGKESRRLAEKYYDVKTVNAEVSRFVLGNNRSVEQGEVRAFASNYERVI